MRTIKLMADYNCFPLWEASPGQVGNIDPRNLPVTDALKEKLMQWARDFDATLNQADPSSSGFQSDQAKEEFGRTGNKLGDQLQQELGPGFTVKRT